MQARRAHVDAQFLEQLAAQRGFRRLAGLDFAAGKLPQPGHGAARRAAGDQHAVVDVDDRRSGDKQDGQAHAQPIADVGAAG